MKTLAFHELVNRIDKLIEAWETGEGPPALADFLSDDAPVRQLLLRELVKVDLEYRWREREQKRLEEYAEEFPELAPAGEMPLSLIWEEYHIRRQHGDGASAEEYMQRFAYHGANLRRLFELRMSGGFSPCLSGVARLPEISGQLDDFELIRPLGEGSFASVYLARQRSMQRLVALKISTTFSNEPQTLAQLDHPNIVRVYDQRILDGGRVQLLYMQYVPGGTLRELIPKVRRAGPKERSGRLLADAVCEALAESETITADSLALAELAKQRWPYVVCRLGAQLAATLAYAHRAGVLHRDLKPANILLTASGVPQLADFNISYCANLAGSAAETCFGGSLAYMSPEQLEAASSRHRRSPAELDGRSDIYSLGVVLWELLTGSLPFRDKPLARGPIEAAIDALRSSRHAGVPPSARREMQEVAPPSLAAVLLKCLEPAAKDRFATADELARQLELCMNRRVQQLMSHSPPPWMRWVRCFPLWFVALAALLPTAVLSVLNIAFNGHSGAPEWAAIDFALGAAAINLVVHSSGLAVVLLLAWPVARGVRASTAHPKLHRLRRRCLQVGEFVVLSCILGWMISGLAFAAWGWACSETVPPCGFSYLVISHVLCGLMAGALAFFTTSFLLVQGLYPVLIDSQDSDADGVRQLSALARRTWFYLSLYVAAPFMSVIALALTGSTWKAAYLVLGLLGPGGFALTLPLMRMIHKDLKALMLVLRPRSGQARTRLIDSSLTETL